MWIRHSLATLFIALAHSGAFLLTIGIVKLNIVVIVPPVRHVECGYMTILPILPIHLSAAT